MISTRHCVANWPPCALSLRSKNGELVLTQLPGSVNNWATTNHQRANMKKVLLAVCGLWLCGAAAQAQNYSIDWFSIDGGGGTSTGGVFSVTGTIGQADAGHMSGGNFTLDGGFWAIIAAVQTPGAPTLRVVRTTTNTVVIAWPDPSI